MKVVKFSGYVVDFESEKLKRSLLKSGASLILVEDIMKQIQNYIYDGITTKKIYKLAFDLLKKKSNSHAARYNLRSAIQMLGPAGFFFEKYVARIFSFENYETKTNLVLQGKCVSHETDVLIKKNNVVEMIECKFHSSREVITDVKVPMYILSRFNDLKENKYSVFNNDEFISKCWIVTNNRFSSDAIAFGICSGLKLLSWNYPEINNIRHKIDNENLYPVTCLTTLTVAEKEKLLILDIVLANEILKNQKSLEKIGLSLIRIKNVLKEVSQLCNLINHEN